MNIDMAALRSLERAKDISLDLLVEAIETALLTAYRHTEGASAHARVELDRKSGDVVVLAQELGDDGAVAREWDDTPEGFGRIATMTAKQVILQRLREAENDVSYGEYAGREGDLVSGIVQQAGQRPGAPVNRNVMVKLGAREDSLEATLPPNEQVPGEVYDHGSRLKCRIVGISRGQRGAQVTVSRTHPDLVRGLFAMEVPEVADGTVEIVALAREAGHRTKIGRRAQRQGGLHRATGLAGPSRTARAARGEDRHHRLARGPRAVRRRGALAGNRRVGRGRRPGEPFGPRGRPGLQAVTRHRQGGPERPPRRATDRLADRHSQRHGGPAGAVRRRASPGGALDSVTARPSGPVRTCVGCRARAAKSTLLRVVGIAGVLTVDPAGRLLGRGASVHPDLACVDLAERRRAFPRALRVPGPLDVGPVREHVAGLQPSTREQVEQRT